MIYLYSRRGAWLSSPPYILLAGGDEGICPLSSLSSAPLLALADVALASIARVTSPWYALSKFARNALKSGDAI